MVTSNNQKIFSDTISFFPHKIIVRNEVIKTTHVIGIIQNHIWYGKTTFGWLIRPFTRDSSRVTFGFAAEYCYNSFIPPFQNLMFPFR